MIATKNNRMQQTQKRCLKSQLSTELEETMPTAGWHDPHILQLLTGPFSYFLIADRDLTMHMFHSIL